MNLIFSFPLIVTDFFDTIFYKTEKNINFSLKKVPGKEGG